MNLFKWFLILMSCILLVGCNKPRTVGDLMEQPHLLQKELERCETKPDSSCEMVKQAGQQFIKLANMRRSNPEAFGKQIMQAEFDWVSEREKLILAERDFDNANSDNRLEMQKKLTLAKLTYQSQWQQVKILWAVVVATSSNDL